MSCPVCDNTGLVGMAFCSCVAGKRKRREAQARASASVQVVAHPESTWVNSSAVDAALSMASKKLEGATTKLGNLRFVLNRQCGEDDVKKAEKVLRLASELLDAMEWKS